MTFPAGLVLAVCLSCLSAGDAAAEPADCPESAGSSASVLKVEAEAVEQRRREFRDCLFLPELYDTRGDRCLTMRLDYQYAKRRYVTAKNALERETKEGGAPCPPGP